MDEHQQEPRDMTRPPSEVSEGGRGGRQGGSEDERTSETSLQRHGAAGSSWEEVVAALAFHAEHGEELPANASILEVARELGVPFPEGLKVGPAWPPSQSTPRREGRRPASARTLEVVDAADVDVRPIEWLWTNHVPLGMETIQFGPGGVGKSTEAIDLAARVTRGAPMPGEAVGREPGAVLYVGAEDAKDRVVVPRLVNAEADLSRGRFGFMGTVRDGDGRLVPLRIPEDVDALGELIEARGATLLIVDPVTAYLGGDVDTHRVTDLRDALLPLQEMIDQTNVATLLIAHPNKDERQASIQRLSGSHAWVDTARSVLGVAPRQDGADGVLVKQLKANVAADVPAFAFTLEPGVTYPQLMRTVWADERVPIGRDELLRKPDRRRESPQLDLAVRLLGELLEAAGGVLEASVANDEAKLAGVSKNTMIRARDQLGLETLRVQDGDGVTRRWVWYRRDGHGWTRLLRLAAVATGGEVVNDNAES